jgi:hypothetical protein
MAAVRDRHFSLFERGSKRFQVIAGAMAITTRGMAPDVPLPPAVVAAVGEVAVGVVGEVAVGVVGEEVVPSHGTAVISQVAEV